MSYRNNLLRQNIINSNMIKHKGNILDGNKDIILYNIKLPNKYNSISSLINHIKYKSTPYNSNYPYTKILSLI